MLDEMNITETDNVLTSTSLHAKSKTNHLDTANVDITRPANSKRRYKYN